MSILDAPLRRLGREWDAQDALALVVGLPRQGVIYALPSELLLASLRPVYPVPKIDHLDPHKRH